MYTNNITAMHSSGGNILRDMSFVQRLAASGKGTESTADSAAIAKKETGYVMDAKKNETLFTIADIKEQSDKKVQKDNMKRALDLFA